MLRRTFLLSPTLALPAVAQEKTMEEKNAEARLFRAESRAAFGRLLMQRFTAPLDAWISIEGPMTEFGNPPVGPARWYLLYLSTRPRVAGDPLWIKFSLDPATRREHRYDYPGAEEYGYETTESMLDVAKRQREGLLDSLMDFAMRKSLDGWAPDDEHRHGIRRTLLEGEAHLYRMTGQDQDVEKAAIKDLLIY